MAFQITIQNDGVDGTVQVTERINLNETVVVFDGFIDAGGTRPAQCQGQPRKDFTWIHRATNMIGGPDSLDDGSLLRVWS